MTTSTHATAASDWPENLHPARNADGWHVHDTEGGTWWPAPDAQTEIAASSDPEAAILVMVQSHPMRGAWHA